MKSTHKTILILVATIFVAMLLARVFGYPEQIVFEGLEDGTPSPAPSPQNVMEMKQSGSLGALQMANARTASQVNAEAKANQTAVKTRANKQTQGTSKTASGTVAKQKYQSDAQASAEKRLAEGRKDVDNAKKLQAKAKTQFDAVEAKRQKQNKGERRGRASNL